jgi:hypothetical protein
VFNSAQKHFVDTLGKILLFLARKNRPKLAKKLSKEYVCKRFIIMIGRIDTNNL